MSREKADKEEKKGFKREALSWVICIVVTILLTEFILNFVIINANIPSGSMENTIMTNDKLIALRTSYWFKDPKRGDIIIFKYPEDEREWYIKRVIALPGETVQIVDGQILINGETYKEGRDFPVISNPGMASSPVTLESGEYFVLGDNRNNSEDSRYGSIGKVNKKYITGKLWFKLFPVKSIGFFE